MSCQFSLNFESWSHHRSFQPVNGEEIEQGWPHSFWSYHVVNCILILTWESCVSQISSFHFNVSKNLPFYFRDKSPESLLRFNGDDLSECHDLRESSYLFVCDIIRLQVILKHKEKYLGFDWGEVWKYRISAVTHWLTHRFTKIQASSLAVACMLM